jgi:hypothetical protein
LEPPCPVKSIGNPGWFKVQSRAHFLGHGLHVAAATKRATRVKYKGVIGTAIALFLLVISMILLVCLTVLLLFVIVNPRCWIAAAAAAAAAAASQEPLQGRDSR